MELEYRLIFIGLFLSASILLSCQAEKDSINYNNNQTINSPTFVTPTKEVVKKHVSDFEIELKTLLGDFILDEDLDIIFDPKIYVSHKSVFENWHWSFDSRYRLIIKPAHKGAYLDSGGWELAFRISDYISARENQKYRVNEVVVSWAPEFSDKIRIGDVRDLNNKTFKLNNGLFANFVIILGNDCDDNILRSILGLFEKHILSIRVNKD